MVAFWASRRAHSSPLGQSEWTRWRIDNIQNGTLAWNEFDIFLGRRPLLRVVTSQRWHSQQRGYHTACRAPKTRRKHISSVWTNTFCPSWPVSLLVRYDETKSPDRKCVRTLTIFTLQDPFNDTHICSWYFSGAICALLQGRKNKTTRKHTIVCEGNKSTLCVRKR